MPASTFRKNGSRSARRAALMLSVALPAMGNVASAATWEVVVNNGFYAPVALPQLVLPYFFSYNQPSINYAGQVVFRARAKAKTGGASGGEPVRGVYLRTGTGPATSNAIRIMADNSGVKVPSPNTTGATFIEFPSIPRADATTNMVATRGQSQPVVTLSDGTKVGTSGIYALYGGNPWVPTAMNFGTGASQVGNVPNYNYFAVPGEPAGTKFDQFPGSPSPLANRLVLFKGNYTVEGVGKTGVFYRDMFGGTLPVQLVVKSGMPIPGAPGKVFGSAAPPSSGLTWDTATPRTVFAGFDNEEAPTAGGIFMADLGNPASLRPLLSIGSQVPGMPPGTTFNRFGEGVSYDGRLASVWGAWGTETKIVHKDCPTDGNKDLVDYCRQQYPNGVDLTVPLNQGVFLIDTTGTLVYPIARTNADGFTDFVYWTYSGKPPGGLEGDDAELPRWRSSAFTAVSQNAMVLKGQKGNVDGLYARTWTSGNLITVLDTTMTGRSVDPAAPDGSRVTAIGLERDGFRGSKVAITASMLNEVTTASWAGIYIHDCGPTCSAW